MSAAAISVLADGTRLEELGHLDGVHALRGVPEEVDEPRPLIVFSSVREERERPEFLWTARLLRRPVLYLTDTAKTWFASRPVAAAVNGLISDEMSRAGVEEIDTLGFSKGGYGALCYAADQPVRRTLSLAPRYAVDRGLIRDPRRRPRVEALSGDLHHPSVEAGSARVGGGVVVHGAWGFDLPHVRRMPPSRAEHWLLAGCGHFFTDFLRSRGLLERLVSAVLEGREGETAKILRRAGGLRRRSLAGRGLLAAGQGALAGYKLVTGQMVMDHQSRETARLEGRLT